MLQMPFKTTHSKQRGAALMVMLVIIVMGATTFLVSTLGSAAIKISHDESTSIALAQAKEALIGYAVTYGDANPMSTHGFLPCPDAGGLLAEEGQESANCGAIDADQIGRLPWKSLGLPPLKDGNGECLWYAVSGTYKSNPATNIPMNWDNTGNLKTYTEQGTQIEANEIVAVIFSPGPVSSQDRSGIVTAPICGGNYNPANYLDNDPNHGGINNTNIGSSSFIMPHEHRDVNGNVTTTINDQFIYITRQDIWRAVQRRVAQEARTCLENYAGGGTYPWAAPLRDTTFYLSTPPPVITDALFGRIPKKDEITDTDILAVIDAMFALQTAADSCKIANNSANRNTLDNAGNNLEDFAKDLRDIQPITPSSPPMPSDVTDPAIAAGNKAQDSGRCADILADPTGNSVQTNLDTTKSEIYSRLDPVIWPVGCSLFTSNTWNHWRDLVFYQVADGFTPIDAGTSCGVNCLKVSGSGHTNQGTGTYHAVVIASGGNLVGSRATATLTDYLEGDNLLPKNTPTLSYKTYNLSDSLYPATNDLVLCLDGLASNCP